MRLFSIGNNQRTFNSEETVIAVTKLLKLRISSSTIRNTLAVHPEYPSLSAISDSLNEWAVENMAVKISRQQLNDIPLPAVVHLQVQREQYFVILKKVNKTFVEYYDTSIGVIKESIDEFCSKWTQNTLLIATTEKSGELNYSLKSREESFQRLSRYTAVTFLLTFFVVPITFLHTADLIIYVLKAIGCILSFILVQKQFGSKNSFINAFCKLGNKSDCDSVIQSPFSKVFGFINLSEVCALYFLGGLISIMIGDFISISTLTSLLFPTAIASLFSLFAIYYQGWIIKKFCPVCLAISGMIWLEFAWQTFLRNSSPSLNSLILISLSFLFPSALWFSIRPFIASSFKTKKLESGLNRFLKNEMIFKKLLEGEAPITVGEFGNEIQAGTDKAPVVLTIISNPDCEPCAYAQQIIEDLLKRFDGKLKVVFRFIASSVDSKKGHEVLRHIFALQINNNNKDALKALSSWYSRKKTTSVDGWKYENPVSGMPDQEAIEIAIVQHGVWCSKIGIIKTPTILINGKKIPEPFSIDDLKFHITKF